MDESLSLIIGVPHICMSVDECVHTHEAYEYASFDVQMRRRDAQLRRVDAQMRHIDARMRHIDARMRHIDAQMRHID